MAYGLSTLKLGTFSKGGNKTATLADCIPVTVEEVGNHYRANADMEAAGRYPFSIEFSKRIAQNQNLIWSLVFGSEHYAGSEEATDFPTMRYEEGP